MEQVYTITLGFFALGLQKRDDVRATFLKQMYCK